MCVLKEHPDWKYIFWTDESMREFVAKEYSWFLETYDAYEYGIQVKCGAHNGFLQYVVTAC